MRYWSTTTDSGSVHCIGNGNILVYEKGPNITHIFGDPYTIPCFPAVYLDCGGKSYESRSTREDGTAIWHHDIRLQGEKAAHIIDFVLPDRNIFIRDIDAYTEIAFILENNEYSPDIRFADMGVYPSDIPGIVGSFMYRAEKGTMFFHRDTIPWEVNMLVTVQGSAAAYPGSRATVLIKPGKSRMIFSSSKDYPSIIDNIRFAAAADSGELLSLTRDYWAKFSAQRHNFAQMIPDGHRHKKRMLEAIDSVFVLIKCQQSSCGGVMAGHHYNLAYVRDMSGVMRGLLALGYIEEAKSILKFWLYKWRLFGDLLNAEGMGNDSSRLKFMNDEVEIPAYIVLDCFIYYDYTHDDEFMAQLFPMMEWAFEVQLPHLVEGMTEFSCDETYVAGGTYPKYLIYHGSAESTLLFITGGEKLINYAQKHGLWSEQKLQSHAEKVRWAKSLYKQNFYENGVLYANNPKREKAAGRPRFRFGFCDGHEIKQQVLNICWTENPGSGYYLCPECINDAMPVFENPEKRYILNSVSLVPLYIGSDIFTRDEIRALIKPGVDIFNKTGAIPSNLEGSRALGYDSGLMLYNMVKLRDGSCERVLDKMLSLLDDTDAWVEYYDNDIPAGCRCRPWESAVNIEALVEYIKALNK